MIFDATTKRCLRMLHRAAVYSVVWANDTGLTELVMHGDRSAGRPGLDTLCRMAVEQNARYFIMEVHAGPKRWFYKALYEAARDRLPASVKVGFTESIASAVTAEWGGFRVTGRQETIDAYDRILDGWQRIFDLGCVVADQAYWPGGAGWTLDAYRMETEHRLQRYKYRGVRVLPLLFPRRNGAPLGQFMPLNDWKASGRIVRGFHSDLAIWCDELVPHEYLEALQ